MNDTVFIIIWSTVILVTAYALLPLLVKPKWKNLHRMANGRNSMTFIHIDPDAPHKLAVLAHELAEWQYRYRRPWSWLRWTATEAVQRDVNLWGPAVETAAAVLIYGADESDFLRKEAWSLSRRHYFGSNWTPERVVLHIDQRMPKARKWVAKHLKQIERYKS